MLSRILITQLDLIRSSAGIYVVCMYVIAVKSSLSFLRNHSIMEIKAWA